VIHVLTAVANALAEAHAIGLIHRDIKPANILLCSQGGHPDVPKVVDFGLVKEVEASDTLKLTHEQTVTGTPLYMAPEAIAHPDRIDARSDLYALGAVGYYLVTAQHVFTAESLVEVCGHHLHTAPIPPCERLGAPVPEDLEAVLLKCLNKEPAARPQSAEDLAALLAQCGDAGRWGLVEARQWWQEHRDEVLGSQQAREASASTKTIAVDLARKST
jgi:serine/threonine-protein kinase